jgi:hypothetical protein
MGDQAPVSLAGNAVGLHFQPGQQTQCRHAYMAGQLVEQSADRDGSALDIGVTLRAGTGPHADLKRSKKFRPENHVS